MKALNGVGNPKAIPCKGIASRKSVFTQGSEVLGEIAVGLML
jgi:hypothetical protein